jgi:hypothetical protein
MVSVDMAWSSEASGIARDAETAARLRQIANADATSIFTGFFLSPPFAATRRFRAYANPNPELHKISGSRLTKGRLTSNGGASGASAGDASPNDGGASPSGDDANPSDAGASPSDAAASPSDAAASGDASALLQA